MDDKLLKEIIEGDKKIDDGELSDNESLLHTARCVTYVPEIVTELLHLRADIAARNAMIYRLAYHAVIRGEDLPGAEHDYITAIANCTHPDDPRYLGEVVIEALSLMEADNAES